MYLLRNQRQVLSRDQIVQSVWGYDYYGDTNVVDVYIRYVRKRWITDSRRPNTYRKGRRIRPEGAIMSLRSKIYGYSSVLFAVLLVAVNLSVYLVFERVSINNEIRRVEAEAESIVAGCVSLLARFRPMIFFGLMPREWYAPHCS